MYIQMEDREGVKSKRAVYTSSRQDPRRLVTAPQDSGVTRRE